MTQAEAPEGKYYGKPCKHGHGAAQGYTLRWQRSRHCVQCAANRRSTDAAAARDGLTCLVCGLTGLPPRNGGGSLYRIHPECRAERRRQMQRDAYRADPIAFKWRTRAYGMGIAVEELQRMYEAAGHACQVCGIREDELTDKYATLAIDHDHRCCPGKRDGGSRRRACGKCVRGLLCPRCNKLLTLADQVTFAAIQDYMGVWNDQ